MDRVRDIQASEAACTLLVVSSGVVCLISEVLRVMTDEGVV